MSVSLPDQAALSVDVAISLGKGEDALPAVLIDRPLVDLLLEIDRAGSVSEACRRLNISTRKAQRMLKGFSDGSGLRLLLHRGSKGTELTNVARQCIALHAASSRCAERLLRESPLPRPL